LLARPGEVLDRRETRHESVEVRERLRHPGLLEQHFREPDAVRVAVPPPREVPAVGSEPAQEVGRDGPLGGQTGSGGTVVDHRFPKEHTIKGGVELEPVAGVQVADVPTVVVVTDETFDQEVIRSTLPVVVDFYADWCAPCRSAEPILQDLSETLAGRVKFTKVNVDESDVVTRSFGIHSIPTYVFLESGRERGREIGPVGSVEFHSILKRYFSFA
jgi:thioredoxin 1